jgi:hypothetical protein
MVGRITRRGAIAFAGLLAWAPVGPAPAAAPTRVAFLGVQFLNDNATLEPTTAAERSRIATLAKSFQAMLEASGRFKFVTVPAAAQAKINNGPVVGSCGGCEFAYGAQLGGQWAAWLVVQKVSNLILNINVYMGDVATGKLTFVHSVDIRGNTDESWAHGIKYLVTNYLLKDAGRRR